MTASYYDESYPPSLWAPEVPEGEGTSNAPTGVNQGTPGEFLPPGSDVPANITALRALGPLGQSSKWGWGMYVILGNSSHAYWSGSGWVAGEAPE